jgi:hypothetical protein
MSAERLSELFDALIRPSFIDCQIERVDGKLETFDPLTLFSSLIESEIDLVSSTRIFDDVIQDIERDRARGGAQRLSHRDLHDRVANAILRFPHPFASFWLSNYEGMFSLEIDQDEDPGDYIDARNAKTLRGEIRFFLEGKRDSLHADSAILRDITNRVVKLIRFCGFYKVRKQFLQQFLEELSSTSAKAFLPNIAISDELFVDRLDQIERMLLIVPDLSPDQHQNFCSTVLTILTAAILGWLGVIHSASNGQSLRHVKAILDDFYRRRPEPNKPRSTLNGSDEIGSLAALRTRLDALLKRAGLSPPIFLDTVDAVIEAFTKTYTSEFIFFTDKLVRYFRMLAIDSELLRTLSSFRFGSDATSYLAAIGHRVTDDGLEVVDRQAQWIDIRLTSRFHKIIEFGDTLRLIVVPHSPDDFDFIGIEEQAEINSSMIFALLVESDLGGEFLARLRTKVGVTRRLISAVRRTQFERCLIRGEDIRTLVHAEFFRHYPEGAEWQDSGIFKFDEPHLPTGLRPREEELFKSALGAIEKGPETTPTIQALHLLESRVREHTLLIHAIALKAGSGADSEVRDFWHEKPIGFGESVAYLRRLSRSTAKLSTRLRKLVPAQKTLTQIDQLRRFRNVIAHNDLIFDKLKAKDVVHQVANVISTFGTLATNYQKVASDSVNRVSFIYGENSSVELSNTSYWSDVISPTKRAIPARWRLGYIDREDRSFNFLALSRCTECEASTHLMLPGLAQRYACESCRMNTLAEGDWAQFLAKLKVQATPETAEPRRGTLSLPPTLRKDEQPMAASWFRSIAEGLLVALGPLGAPLKIVLDHMDKSEFERLEEKIDLITQNETINKADIVAALQSVSITRPLSWALSGWIERYRAENGDLLTPKEMMPVSGSQVSERELSEELTRLYPEFDLLVSDFRKANINVARVKKTGISEVDIGNMILHLRGQTLQTILLLAQILKTANPGSTILETLDSSLWEFIRLSDAQENGQ